ncbi:MAG: hypothetical protein QM777_10155 [Pseudorhodoferax sp.]
MDASVIDPADTGGGTRVGIKGEQLREWNFRRDFDQKTPFEARAWAVIQQQVGDDPDLVWEGFVSRRALSENADPTNVQHYDIGFKVRFNKLDMYQFYLALSDRSGGYRNGAPTSDAYVERVFVDELNSSDGYRLLYVDGYGSSVSLFYSGIDGFYSTAG